MAKRGADNYLTHDNFNDEDEEEERGSFKQASNTVLNTREIKKAKRRFGGQDLDSSGGAFQTFTGLTSSKSNGAPAFSFGSVANKSSSLSTPVSSASVVRTTDSVSLDSVNSLSKSSNVSSPAASFSFVSKTQPFFPVASSQTSSKESSTKTSLVMSAVSSVDKNGKQPESNYAREIKALNEGFLRWIEQQLRTKPVCLLTPIFADYQRYADELDKKYPVEADHSSVAESAGSNNASGVSGGIFGFQQPASTSNKGFQASEQFGSVVSSSTVTTASLPTTSSFAPPSSFTFGSNKPTSVNTGLFNTSASMFGSGTPPASNAFSFSSSLVKPASAAAQQPSSGPETAPAAEGDDDEYVPPKPDVIEVKEDDAFYTVKCKLFYKKETIWQERGVGNLFLKPCGGKTQLLIRADTNLGNILLNIVLNKSIPVSRQGTNNVSLICVPNPPIERNKDDKTPVCLLIRVKTSDIADELLNQMNNSKS